MAEKDFQRKVIARLKKMFPGCHIVKQDAGFTQGIPDLLILYNNKWAMLEVKVSEAVYLKDSGKRPNQPYWVDHFNQMSFARFIFPENMEEVLNELEQTFRT